MSEYFWQEGIDHVKLLPAEFEGAMLLIDMQGREGQEPDWALIDAFEALLLREGAALELRVQEPLKGLAMQTGWFSDNELAGAYFAWAEIVLLYEVSESRAKWGAGPTFELQFSLESPSYSWLDTYGNWIATFDKMALTGLRREQR